MMAKSSLLLARFAFSRRCTHPPLQQAEALPEAERLPLDLLQQPSEREQGTPRGLGQMLEQEKPEQQLVRERLGGHALTPKMLLEPGAIWVRAQLSTTLLPQRV